MAIATELETLKTNITNAYNSINTKGGTIPTNKNTENLSSAIESIPSGGSDIPDNAHIVFSNYDDSGYIKKATIKTAWVSGENKYIAGYALYGTGNRSWYINNVCNSLIEIVIIPRDITTIYDGAFQNCTSLKTINLPDTITTFKSGIFNNCNSLPSIHLPESLVGDLPNNAFNKCRSLSNITIPVGITSIDYGCFEYCSALAKVTVLGNITSIGGFCFDNCSKLVTLVMSNITQVPTMTGVNVFNNTPISKGTGYIYVPDDMVDSFKSATNWSSFAGQIKPISEYVEEET